MPQIKKGQLRLPPGSPAAAIQASTIVMQPGRKIAYKADGTAEGSVTFKLDVSDILKVKGVGSPHPDDYNLICHHAEATFEKNNQVTVVNFYHGIRATYSGLSRDTIDYCPAVDIVPIQLHPDFPTFAGKPSEPKNGAFWANPETGARTTDDTNAEFIGFTDPTTGVVGGKFVDNAFFGVEHYFVNRPMVTRTYWTKSRPNIDKAMTIVNKIPGFTNPPGVKNWLIMDTPYRDLGGTYQVTVQYKGSMEPGWNDVIYPQS